MDLIKTLDDERLGDTAIYNDEYGLKQLLLQRGVLVASLRAAIKERDAALEEEKECVRHIAQIAAERDAALSQQLAARDALIEIVNNCGCADDTDFCMNCVCANEAIAALSSSSPCPHEAEVSKYKAELEAVYKALDTKIVNDERIKQLEEAVEWVLGIIEGEDEFYVYWSEIATELRRRAGKEGK